MPVERSLIAFRSRKKNCAQSVLVGFQELSAVPDADIEEARRHGGGRAEEGRCGALDAALQLAQKPETKEKLRHAFENSAGSVYCREIRTKGQLKCEACVELAVAVLAQEEFKEKR